MLMSGTVMGDADVTTGAAEEVGGAGDEEVGAGGETGVGAAGDALVDALALAELEVLTLVEGWVWPADTGAVPIAAMATGLTRAAPITHLAAGSMRSRLT
jgi:hypothetical protein